MRRPRKAAPFFGLDDSMPVLLGLMLGLQHALAMLAGVITPPILIAGQTGANLNQIDTQYLVSTALIVSCILSAVQITRFHLYRTPYYLGTGLISVLGTSYATVAVSGGVFKQMYRSGFCPSGPNGGPLPCPDGYGALIGTACVTAFLEIFLSFLPPKVLQKIFPPLVTGPTVTLIGIHISCPYPREKLTTAQAYHSSRLASQTGQAGPATAHQDRHLDHISFVLRLGRPMLYHGVVLSLSVLDSLSF